MDTSKPARWFRLYAEFATDPKVQMLSEVDQRRFLMLLCLRCSNGDVTLHETQIAFQLRISEEEWAKTKAILIANNLISDDNKPTAWEARQYASDSSTARVSRWRENKKQRCNVTETTVKLPQRQRTETELTSKPLSECNGKKLQKMEAIEILSFLNSKTEHGYRAVEANLTPILARLKEGADPQDIRSVIAMKAREWKTDEAMSKYLRPSTLFNKTKFWQYHGQLIQQEGTAQ